MFEKMKSYSLIGVGVMIGIMIVSITKHGGIDWMSISKATGMTAILFISYLLIHKGTKKIEQKNV